MRSDNLGRSFLCASGCFAVSQLVFCFNTAYAKNVVVHIGYEKKTAEQLHLSPTRGASRGSSYYVPSSVAAAVLELDKMLEREDMNVLLSSSGTETDFAARDGSLLDIGTWMYDHWNLDKKDSRLAAEMGSLGFESQIWMARALFEMVYERHKTPKYDEMLRLKRFAYIEQQDGRPPATPPPKDCAAQSAYVKGADVWLGQEERWPYGRLVRWVDCNDGTKRAYLWEREWFVPDPSLDKQLINEVKN